MRFRTGGILVVFHFFTPEEIECDIDPREVSGQASLDALLGFKRRLGDLTRKPAALTPENVPDEPIISYDPESSSFLSRIPAFASAQGVSATSAMPVPGL